MLYKSQSLCLYLQPQLRLRRFPRMLTILSSWICYRTIHWIFTMPSDFRGGALCRLLSSSMHFQNMR